MFFSLKNKKNLLKAALFQNTPVYVQFYITARCNLTCQQCNIIYANSDVQECSLDEIKRVADNLSKLGVVMVLLTGGEPFVRKDLPEIIREFEIRGIHVRMQTNGLATEEQIHKAIEYGGRDISVSLDSLRPEVQDKINGDFKESWHRALKAISHFTHYLPPKGSFASLGCVLQPDNINCIEDVIQFGTAIDWYTSLVPVHVTNFLKPLGFRTFDKKMMFSSTHQDNIERLIEHIREMRQDGYLLYDSDQYLDDIKRFLRKEPITWRSKNGNICDSPNLYFAILPNGHFAPCCDYRIPKSIPVYAPNFPHIYQSRIFRDEVSGIVTNCEGCMYGSYPEMTITTRFNAAKLQRAKIFLSTPTPKKWPIKYERMLEIIHSIRGI